MSASQPLRTGSPIVAAHSASVEFGSGARRLRVLHEIDFSVQRGEFVAVLGPSGCGKSTLLRTVAGLIPLAAGSMQVQLPPRTIPPLSFNFQSPVLLSWLGVEANALLPYEVHGIRPGPETTTRLNDLLAMVGLLGFRDALPSELSGGMQMRASLVRSFLTEPDLVLMDEPFAALDELTRRRLCVELQSLWYRQRSTILFVTHNVEEAVFLADRILVLSHRPARIIREWAVPFARPRPLHLRGAGPFVDLVGSIQRGLGHD